MAISGFVARHRARVASGAALVLAAVVVTAYALTSDGYRVHEADLNDGGVWVVNGAKGWSGRVNKPINQIDGVVPGNASGIQMDILQDGSAVVALDMGADRGQVLETARLTTVDGGAASVPDGADLAMAGGTLASAERETGKVWAVRYDPRAGQPLVTAVDDTSEPLEVVGPDAALAVTASGAVVAVSAEDGAVVRIEPAGSAYAQPERRSLPAGTGEPSDVTAVGERVVTLDQAAGTLHVLDGPTVDVPPGSVLQQAGPSAATVLVGTDAALLEVDLASGDVATVAEASGVPVAPVRLGACTFGAWGGGVGWTSTQCGEEQARVRPVGGDASQLAFRVNRGEIVLNDALSGSVWDVQQEKPVKIDNWEAFTHRKKKDDDKKKDEDRTDEDRRPPKARPDSYGVRAGRTTVLHPLDNDSAPEGRLLSIIEVDQPDDGSKVEISPDGQTLVVSVPEQVRTTSFEYHVDDGRSGITAHAPVTVKVRPDQANAAPALRTGYVAPSFQMANGGSISVPVLADWRDREDGDSLLLESAVAVGAEEQHVTARPTSDGRIRVSAPALPGSPARTVRVDYTVTDGRSAPVESSLDFTIQAARDTSAHPPVAQPDVVRGEVGKPIKIRPLLNDLPGSDPGAPYAELTLAGKVAPQPGLTIRTDTENGVVRVSAQRAGTYFIGYDAAFGAAPLDKGTVRLDVRPRPRRASEPVAMPDTLTVFGQAPGLVDVLTNDFDQAGRLLTVQRADPERRGALDVAVVDGRWLRVSASTPALQPQTQTIAYTVTNGAQSTRGELVVTQRPAPEDNTPITVTDRVVVRAGTSATIPVLDNDVSPSGDRLSLAATTGDQGAGRLHVGLPVGVQGEPGEAFVSGRVVRYVAPTGHAQRQVFEVPYIAQNQAGDTAEGLVLVTVVPQDADNRPPEPPVLEGRVVAGDVVKVRVPGHGIDPDGDPVTVTGITSAPRLGRIISSGGNFLEYQAYPRMSGTDEFDYAVVDAQGAVATGTVRVAVVAPVDPQPPLAVADRMVVAPGRTAVFDPLANDFVASGDRVSVELLGAPEGVTLDPATNFVTVRAPDSEDADTAQVVYRLTNGLAESRATISLETQRGYNNPPVVHDAFGRADDGAAVEVDVLEGAYDPDGAGADLEVVRVFGDPTARIAGSRVTVRRGEHPKVVPFSVSDAEGGVATASIYVPPRENAMPYVRPDALVEVDPGGSFTGDVADFVDVAGARTVRLVAGSSALAASPMALSVTRKGENGFTLRAPEGHQGPGALLVEVTTASDAAGNENPDDLADGVTALLSIPVRVGDDVPVLQCPDSTIAINISQRVDLDIATVCSVWTLDPRDAAGLDYSAQWATPLEGLSLGTLEGSVVAVTASADAVNGGEAVLAVRAGRSNTEQVRFRLTSAPSPTLGQIPAEDLRAGESRTIDLAPFLRAGVPQPRPTVVSVQALNRTAVRASHSGSRVTFRAPKGSSGMASFRVIVSDVGSADPPAARRAEGRIQLEVGGVPGAPTGLMAFAPLSERNTIRLTWNPPEDTGGSRITRYQVREVGSGRTRDCLAIPCTLRNMESGRTYAFQVRAVNKVGPGEWSTTSDKAQVNNNPGPVSDLRVLGVGDGSIRIGWGPPTENARNLQAYEIRYAGRSVRVTAATTDHTAVGLDNNRTYVFEVRAINDVGISAPAVTGELQSIGTPAAPTGVQAADVGDGSEPTSVKVSWNDTAAEGPGATMYTLRRAVNGGADNVVAGCSRITSTQCVDSGVTYNGATLRYTVVAHNTRNTSAPSAPGEFVAVGRPAAWSEWQVEATGADQQARVTATVPDPRGAVATVAILVDGRVVKQLVVREGQRIDEIVRTSGNDAAATVTLRLCNENGACESSDRSVQTYGRFSDAHLDDIRAQVSGKTITWQVSGTSNGNAGRLRVWFDGTLHEEVALPDPGGFSRSYTVEASEFRQDKTIKVELYDDNPLGRGNSVEQLTTRSADPPAPKVLVAKGAACKDGTTNGCKPADRMFDPTCAEDACARVNLTLQGWENWGSASPTCTYSHAQNNWFDRDSITVAQADTPADLRWYSPGGEVTITCTTSGPDGTTASGSVTW